ncbi:MAG: GntR family transcriptional regulator [Synergistaceae bacterium]|jgi:GntR family transcriptional regulator|nr:GntR family transcriptional regulator [Synergistaceae bacterium]
MNDLAVKICDAVRRGVYKTGKMLPLVASLAKKYGAGEDFVREGIGDLVYEGVVERVPGRASRVRVREPYLWDLVTGNHSFTGEAKRRGQKPGNRILTFEKRPAWPQVANRLKLNEGDEVNVMERLLLADDKPVGLEFSYMPSKFYAGVTREMFEGGKSTFAVMETFGHVSAKAVDELSAATLEAREAEILGMSAGVPVLIRFRVTLNPEGTPIKGSRAIYLFNPGYSVDI